MAGKFEFLPEQGESTTDLSHPQRRETELPGLCLVQSDIDVRLRGNKEAAHPERPQHHSVLLDASGVDDSSQAEPTAEDIQNLGGLSRKRRRLSHSQADRLTDVPRDHGLSAAISNMSTNTVSEGPFVQSIDIHPAVNMAFGIGQPNSATHIPAADDTGHVHQDHQALARKPAKQLRLDGKGGMNLNPLVQSSPRRKAEKPVDLRLMRPQPGKRKCTVAAIRYGHHDSDAQARIADRIEAILQCPPNPRAPEKTLVEATTARPPPSAVVKATHPFFVGKRAAASENASNGPDGVPSQTRSPASRSYKSYTTPRKFQPETAATDNLDSSPIRRSTSFRLPGTHEALWPAGDFFNTVLRNRGDQESVKHVHIYNGERKLKTKAILVAPEESILNRRWQHIRTTCAGSLGQDSALYEGLRMPQRLVMNGLELRHQLNTQLHCHVMDKSRCSPIGSRVESPKSQSHPAVQRLFDNLPDMLGPFDKNESDNLSWLQKYAPQTSADVLHTGKETHALKSWLQGLTVTSIQKQFNSDSEPKRMDDSIRRKKKRKIHSELDDFIVGSDDESAPMQDLNDVEANHGVANQNSIHSVIRGTSGDSKGARSPNVVMLSGPSGCGKSAAVYAVAKELGFDVFEINPGTRRSGKDVLDRVGNMTQNHLVHQTDNDQSSLGSTTKVHVSVTAESAITKQKSLQSFFGGSKLSTPNPIDHAPGVTVPAARPAQKSGKQKQSLILLEEVDILFEDDKQFWDTILGLAHRSKRPIIMTCNDESMIPLQTLSLHAILRFQPPPIDLAIDYLLLMAAAEGHILERSALEHLYECCTRDLRAAIAQLDFSCQMGLGDRKGGFDWLFKRWPKGSDLDAGGRKLRVISKGTYHKNLDHEDDNPGCLQSSCDDRSADDQLLTSWERDGVLPAQLVARAWTREMVQPGSMPPHRGFDNGNITALRDFCLFADVQSEADVFCKVDLPCTDTLHEIIDSTEPPMRSEARCNYVDGLPLLQAKPKEELSQLDTKIAIGVQLCLSRVMTMTAAFATKPPPALQTDQLRDSIATAALSRSDFSSALDAIASDQTTSTTPQLGSQLTSFDREFRVVVEDLAPYVRSIGAYDLALEKQREHLSEALSQSSGTTRVRTTRASRSALEGSARSNTRRERWFASDFDLAGVMKTGGSNWPQASVASMSLSADEQAERASSAEMASRAGTDDEGGSTRPRA